MRETAVQCVRRRRRSGQGWTRPVRGIVESWVRAKVNSCSAGASGRSAGWPVPWARSRPWV